MSRIHLLWICGEAAAAETFRPDDELIRVESAPAGRLDRIARGETGEGADAILAELPLHGWSAESALAQLRAAYPGRPVILRDPRMSTGEAVRLARLGAWQCLGAGSTQAELEETLRSLREDRAGREENAPGGESEERWKRLLVGDSLPIRQVGTIIRMVADRRATVLITGETGTGKEVVARALHCASRRSRLPMVSVNCGALPEHLLEAELFGHVKGAFTGAHNHRIGRFEQANNSTLFLDEIGDMPVELQVKLLRALQEREIQRLGSSQTIKVDVRVIAASNANLLERVRQGKFREDLYYRLKVVPVEMPALRDRLEDVAALVRHFIDKICRLENLAPKEIGAGAIERLCGYAWPGNVRELENAVEMAIALSGDRLVLYASDFPLGGAASRKIIAMKPAGAPLPESGIDFHRAVSEYEQELIEQALARTGGNKTYAADLLGLKRTTLLAKLRQRETPFRPARTA